jgi:hypothetical protein
VASEATGAPQVGQFMVSGVLAMRALYYMGSEIFASGSEGGVGKHKAKRGGAEAQNAGYVMKTLVPRLVDPLCFHIHLILRFKMGYIQRAIGIQPSRK